MTPSQNPSSGNHYMENLSEKTLFSSIFQSGKALLQGLGLFFLFFCFYNCAKHLNIVILILYKDAVKPWLFLKEGSWDWSLRNGTGEKNLLPKSNLWQAVGSRPRDKGGRQNVLRVICTRNSFPIPCCYIAVFWICRVMNGKLSFSLQKSRIRVATSSAEMLQSLPLNIWGAQSPFLSFFWDGQV